MIKVQSVKQRIRKEIKKQIDTVTATGSLKSDSIIEEVEELVVSKATSLESKVENHSKKKIEDPEFKDIKKFPVVVEREKEEEARETILVFDGIETPEL